MNKSLIVPFLLKALRILLGLAFIFSGYTKIQSLDNFELYIFSQHIFSFNTSAFLARLIIAFEWVLGALLISNFYFKTAFRLSVILLLGFTVFLIVKLFSAPDENCHCFGSAMALNPLQSIIKNILWLGLFFVIRHQKTCEWRFRKWAVALIIPIVLVLPFILSAPDFIYNKIYKPFYEIEGEAYISISDESLAYNKGKKILFFSSMHCPYCILAAQKLSIMVDESSMKANIYYYFFGNEEDLEEFWHESSSSGFAYAIIPFAELINITGGGMPVLFFVEDGKIISKHGYRTFSEKDLNDFFEN